MAGSIGFVGLVVPHDAFLLWPAAPNVADSPSGALAGAILMVLAITASRLLIAPQSLPVGVVTAWGWGAFLCRDYLPLKE
ncbi:iron ABC transporter permease [Klebsiella pneumoniae]|nr:iron ABC transporter permease [Klebsiella pneumoniae]